MSNRRAAVRDVVGGGGRSRRTRRTGTRRFRERDQPMTHYLLTIYQPDGGTPPPEFLAKVGRDLHALNQEIKAAGAWVFSRGLHAPSTATVVRQRGREVLTTDGPYVEGKEHVGGFWIVKAANLNEALEWGRKGALACRAPVELRPFLERTEEDNPHILRISRG
jgi:hypothetical protein